MGENSVDLVAFLPLAKEPEDLQLLGVGKMALPLTLQMSYQVLIFFLFVPFLLFESLDLGQKLGGIGLLLHLDNLHFPLEGGVAVVEFTSRPRIARTLASGPGIVIVPFTGAAVSATVASRLFAAWALLPR
jgi:hypothetical protein